MAWPRVCHLSIWRTWVCETWSYHIFRCWRLLIWTVMKMRETIIFSRLSSSTRNCRLNDTRLYSLISFMLIYLIYFMLTSTIRSIDCLLIDRKGSLLTDLIDSLRVYLIDHDKSWSWIRIWEICHIFYVILLFLISYLRIAIDHIQILGILIVKVTTSIILVSSIDHTYSVIVIILRIESMSDNRNIKRSSVNLMIQSISSRLISLNRFFTF